MAEAGSGIIERPWEKGELLVALWAYRKIALEPDQLRDLARETADLLNRPLGQLFRRLQLFSFLLPLPGMRQLIHPLPDASLGMVRWLDPYLKDSPQNRQRLEDEVSAFRAKRISSNVVPAIPVPEAGSRINERPWKQVELLVALWTYRRISLNLARMPEVAQEAADLLNRPLGELYTRLKQISFILPQPGMRQLFHPLADGSSALLLRLDSYREDSPQNRQRLEDVVAAFRAMGARPSIAPVTPISALEAVVAGPLTAFPAISDQAGLGKLAAQLQRWQRWPSEMKDLWCSRPFDSRNLATLARDTSAMERSVTALAAVKPPDPQELARAIRAWQSAEGDALRLDRRTIKVLCQHTDTALDPGWVTALFRAGGLPVRRAWFEALLSAYLARWRTMAQPEALEEALRGLVQKAAAGQRWAANLKEDVFPLLGAEAPERLLAGAADPLAAWEPVIERWSLARTHGLGAVVLERALRKWCGDWLAGYGFPELQARLDNLASGLSLLTRESGLAQGVFTATVSDLILAGPAARHPEIREALIHFALRHPRLGDPRVKAHLWVAMPSAKARLIGWMAQKDLRLFYDYVVADGQDAQGRKVFWNRFLDQVTNFRLVLEENDRDRLVDRLAEHGVSYAVMEGPNQVSAFILRFDSRLDQSGLVCVEFSRSGNSLYFYDPQTFEREVARMDAKTFRASPGIRNLKDQFQNKHRLPHIANWQWKATEYLQQHGIKET